MFKKVNFNWNDLDTSLKRGSCVIKELVEKNGTLRLRWVKDTNIPTFTQDKSYIEELVFTKKEI